MFSGKGKCFECGFKKDKRAKERNTEQEHREKNEKREKIY